MKCARCGAEVAEGFAYCPACGRSVAPPPPGHEGVEQIADEAARAAKDLVRSAARFTKMVMDKTDQAAQKAPGTAKRAVDDVVVELRKAKAEIDRALKDLE